MNEARLPPSALCKPNGSASNCLATAVAPRTSFPKFGIWFMNTLSNRIFALWYAREFMSIALLLLASAAPAPSDAAVPSGAPEAIGAPDGRRPWGPLRVGRACAAWRLSSATTAGGELLRFKDLSGNGGWLLWQGPGPKLATKRSRKARNVWGSSCKVSPAW